MSDIAASANPFRPGAGRVPPELAGRDAILSTVGRTMESVLATGEGDRPIVISGLRGVGKTVLLNEFVRRAERSGRWIAVKVEASPDRSLEQALLRELHPALRRMMSRSDLVREKLGRALRVFRSFQLRIDPTGTYSFGFEVGPEPGVADSGVPEQDLRDLLEELALGARDLDMGVLIAVDELQEAPRPDLNALNVTLHTIGQSSWPVPVVMIGTGLPSLPAVLADATSYAERLYDFRTLTLLSDDETQLALTLPTSRHGVEWHDGAIALALRMVAGYPYFAQAFGKHAWDGRQDPEFITVEDAEFASARAREEVDGLYQSRWDRATPMQRQLMRAMADDLGAPSAIQDLVVRTGKSRTSDLSVSRRELIRGGHIYPSDRGFLAFTLPGMDDFIHRTVRDL